MYVIFPADEVVYLSYGRLIYVPSSAPTTPSPLEGPVNNQQQGFFDTVARNPSKSSINRHDRRTRKRKEATLNRTCIIASRSFEILNQPSRPKNEKKERTEKSALRHAYLEVPKSTVAPKRNGADNRKASYSDFAQANRPQRSAGVAATIAAAQLAVKSSESEANCSRYKSEYKEHKLPVAVTQYSKPEKSPAVKKKGIFSGVRLKRTPETVADKMAAGDSEITRRQEEGHLQRCPSQEDTGNGGRQDGGRRFRPSRPSTSALQRTSQVSQFGHVQVGTNR
ncbi:hypothetical protein QE152_g23006 [Popillia japonica]|uniref:Uncharacterized protein n=1 Tax=Popillia japonica TaxID=7064 RepID=A0AAW1KIX2_POPJA